MHRKSWRFSPASSVENRRIDPSVPIDVDEEDIRFDRTLAGIHPIHSAMYGFHIYIDRYMPSFFFSQKCFFS